MGQLVSNEHKHIYATGTKTYEKVRPVWNPRSVSISNIYRLRGNYKAITPPIIYSGAVYFVFYFLLFNLPVGVGVDIPKQKNKASF